MLARIMDVTLIVNPYASEVTQERVQAVEQELARGAALEQGRSRTISLGRVNGRRFGFASGIGFDAELMRRVDRLGRRADGRRPGDLAFIREAATFVGRRLGRFEPVFEIEGLGRA